MIAIPSWTLLGNILLLQLSPSLPCPAYSTHGHILLYLGPFCPSITDMSFLFNPSSSLCLDERSPLSLTQTHTITNALRASVALFTSTVVALSKQTWKNKKNEKGQTKLVCLPLCGFVWDQEIRLDVSNNKFGMCV